MPIQPGSGGTTYISDTFVAASQVAMLALDAWQGDVCVRTDLSTTFILTNDEPTLLASWQEILFNDAVVSVNGKSGTVSLNAAEVGAASTAHATGHVTGGSDVIAAVIAAGASGLMTGADKTKLDSVGANADVTADNAPQAHKTSHENGGTDEISVAGLSGVLADDQHIIDSEAVAAAKTVKLDELTAPTDNTTLDFSTSLHGLVPKGTDVGDYLKDNGTWADPVSAVNAILARITTPNAIGNSSATLTVDFDDGYTQTTTLNSASVAITLSNIPAVGVALKMTQDGSGSRDPDFSGNSVKWEGGTEPTWSTGAGDIDLVMFRYDGTNIIGAALIDVS